MNHVWLSNHLLDSEIHLYIDQSNKNFSVYSVFKSSRICRLVIDWSIENMSNCTRCHYVGVSVRLTTDPTNIVFQLYQQKWTIVLIRTFDNLSIENWTFDWINLVKVLGFWLKYSNADCFSDPTNLPIVKFSINQWPNMITM